MTKECTATLRLCGKCAMPVGHLGPHKNIGMGWCWVDSSSGATPHADSKECSNISCKKGLDYGETCAVCGGISDKEDE